MFLHYSINIQSSMQIQFHLLNINLPAISPAFDFIKKTLKPQSKKKEQKNEKIKLNKKIREIPFQTME